MKTEARKQARAMAQKTLDKLEKGEVARVIAIKDEAAGLVARLREIGFAEENEVELLHRGPILGRPLCFRLNRTQIALRPLEARAIRVEVEPHE